VKPNVILLVIPVVLIVPLIGVTLIEFACIERPPATRPWMQLALEIGLYAYDGYILEAARSSGYPLLTLDRTIGIHAQKLGLPLVEIEP